MSEANLWKYCTGEQCTQFLLSLKLTGEMKGSRQQLLSMLYELSNHPERHYRKKRIPKKTGGYRMLWIPDQKLAYIQRQILKNVLLPQKVSPYAFAYRKGISLRENCACHVGQPTVVKLDIQDFFGQISWLMVYQKVFPAQIFPPAVRGMLTHLCCFHEALPQGAPTSPAVSNLVMKTFDDTMGEWCRKREIQYSRYCDDLTFSGAMDPGLLIRKTAAYLETMGFSLNEKKTGVYTQGARQEVTGVTVNEKLQVPAAYRRKLRQEWYYCKRYGVEEHLKRIGYEETVQSYLNRLQGKIQFVLQINPEDEIFQKYWSEIREIVDKVEFSC